MLQLKALKTKIVRYIRQRQAAAKLQQLSDRSLNDIGIKRCDIERVVADLK